jgi:predicted GNAT family acetyltransferase
MGTTSLVATSHAHGLAGRYSELGVSTLPAWRGQGLGVAVASLVAECVQRDGGIPVWVAGHDNVGSLSIAEKLGFAPAFGRCFVISS